MGELLDAEDLAYMRETQTEARPTEGLLLRRTQGVTASGGRGNTYAEPEPIGVRLDGKESSIPAQVVALVGKQKAVKLVVDLMEVRSGDQIKVGGAIYEVVTDGDPDEWATAQVIWAKQTQAPPRA
jgi:hypothetical protein